MRQRISHHQAHGKYSRLDCCRGGPDERGLTETEVLGLECYWQLVEPAQIETQLITEPPVGSIAHGALLVNCGVP
jgi:hypothetical protein